MGLIFFAQNEIHIIYIFSKGSSFFPTFKSRMYRMFQSFQNLDGNIYSWNLYVWRFLNVASTSPWCCQDGATAAAGCGEVYRWRLSEALGRWRARVFVERFWLDSSNNGWIKYEKLWFNGFDHHKWIQMVVSVILSIKNWESWGFRQWLWI